MRNKQIKLKPHWLFNFHTFSFRSLLRTEASDQTFTCQMLHEVKNIFVSVAFRVISKMVLRSFFRPSIFFKSFVIAVTFFLCKPLFNSKFGLRVEETPLIDLQEIKEIQLESVNFSVIVEKVVKNSNQTDDFDRLVKLLRYFSCSFEVIHRLIVCLSRKPSEKSNDDKDLNANNSGEK